MEKEKIAAEREAEESQAALESEQRQKGDLDRLAKRLEVQLSDAQLKSDEQLRQLNDLQTYKMRASQENSELSR